VGTSVGQIKFKAPGGAYATLTATTTDFGTGSVNGPRYQSFVDVTARVAAGGAGTYAAGDVSAGTGGDRYAGWSLVVAYRDAAQPPRNLTVFDGLVSVAPGSPPATIPVSGFQTPQGGPVRTTLGFVAYEGDLFSNLDSASLNGTVLTNSANPATNFFDSSISNAGVTVLTRNPAYTNTMGYDSDLVDRRRHPGQRCDERDHRAEQRPRRVPAGRPHLRHRAQRAPGVARQGREQSDASRRARPARRRVALHGDRGKHGR
jgi:hypothetical protein